MQCPVFKCILLRQIVLYLHICISDNAISLGLTSTKLNTIYFRYENSEVPLTEKSQTFSMKWVSCKCKLETRGTKAVKISNMWVFFDKNIKKKHLCHHEKNYCYFCKLNIPVINLIVGSENIIKLFKKYKFVKN